MSDRPLRHPVLPALLAVLLLAPLAAQGAPRSLEDVRRAARERLAEVAPETLPAWLTPERTPEELAEELAVLSRLNADELASARWTPIRLGEGSRYVTWSGNGQALAWVDRPDERGGVVRLWHLGEKLLSLALPTSEGWTWTDSLALDDEGLMAVTGSHVVAAEGDHHARYLWTLGGTRHRFATYEDDPQLRHGVGCFAGDRFLTAHVRLQESRLAPWATPLDLRVAWIDPMEAGALDLSSAGYPYGLREITPTRLAAPSWARGVRKAYLAMGVQDPRRARPALVVRGLAPGEHAARVFTGEEDPEALSFQVPGSPLALSAADDGSLFAYTHGGAPTRTLDEAGEATVRAALDSVYAHESRGFLLLRSDGRAVRVPSPRGQVCHEVSWRPGGLELAISTDWNGDGRLDLVLWDPTDVVRADPILVARRVAREATTRPSEPPPPPEPATPEPTPPPELAPPTPAPTPATPIPMAPTPTTTPPAPDDPSDPLAAARAALARHDLAAAQDQALAAARLDPEDAGPELVLASVEITRGQRLKAQERLGAAYAFKDLDAEETQEARALGELARGLDALEAKDPDSGLAALARAVQAWPNVHNRAYPHLCRQALLQKDFVLGPPSAEEWVRLGGGATARSLHVRLLLAAGRAEEALLQARKMVKALPGELEGRLLLGDALLATGRAQDALAVFEEVRDVDPHQAGLAARLKRAAELAGPGATRTPKPHCPQCGKVIEPGVNFCPVDGARVR